MIMRSDYTCDPDEDSTMLLETETLSILNSLVLVQPDVRPYLFIDVLPDSSRGQYAALAVLGLIGCMLLWMATLHKQTAMHTRRRWFYSTQKRRLPVSTAASTNVEAVSLSSLPHPIVQRITTDASDQGWTTVRRRWYSDC
jgi:hypothetical protein